MNPKVPPALNYLRNNPGASVFNVAIDYAVSYSTLRKAWAKTRPGVWKVGRPQSDRTNRAIAYLLVNPGATQVSTAQRFKITPTTLCKALRRLYG
jgi:hypothetical protein